VAAHDRVRDGEPEAGAAPRLLGREERLEDVRQHVRRDTRTVVADDHDDVVVVAAQLDRQRTVRGERVGRVHQEVHEHLIQLRRIARDVGDVVPPRDDPYPVGEAMADERERALDPRP